MNATYISRIAPVLILFALLMASCKEKLDEPLYTGRYFIENNTGLTLKVQAKDGAEFIVLQNSQIAPYAKEKIYDAENFLSSSVQPSLFFSDFKVFINIGVKDSTLYHRVRDSDWEEGETTDEYQELILSIPQ